MTEVIQPIPARLKNVAVGGHVAGAEDIIDDALQKDQATINQEVQEAIGTGGSVDSRISAAINALDASVSKSAGADGLALSVIEENGKITAINGSIASNTYDAYGSASAAQSAAISAAATDATTKVNAAKAEIKGNATSACDTLGEAEALISAEKTRAQGAETVLDGRIDTLEETVENVAYLGENDGSAVVADFDPQTDTVWKKAQTLSNAEKSQVKTNLGIPQEIYSKTEVNELVSTPHQNYVTVATYSELPASGSTDTIYRVSNYDGTQVATGVYSEYAWNGSDYVFLAAKSSVGEVFDISEYHAGAKYADLAAALDSDNGGGVPQSLQKGGMSIKFVLNSDNKYVQYRLISNSFNTTVANWQGVDDEPTAGSDNLVKSSGVKEAINPLNGIVVEEKNFPNDSILFTVADYDMSLGCTIIGSATVNVFVEFYNSQDQQIGSIGNFNGTDIEKSTGPKQDFAYAKVKYGALVVKSVTHKLQTEANKEAINSINTNIENIEAAVDKLDERTNRLNGIVIAEETAFSMNDVIFTSEDYDMTLGCTIVGSSSSNTFIEFYNSQDEVIGSAGSFNGTNIQKEVSAKQNFSYAKAKYGNITIKSITHKLQSTKNKEDIAVMQPELSNIEEKTVGYDRILDGVLVQNKSFVANATIFTSADYDMSKGCTIVASAIVNVYINFYDANDTLLKSVGSFNGTNVEKTVAAIPSGFSYAKVEYGAISIKSIVTPDTVENKLDERTLVDENEYILHKQYTINEYNYVYFHPTVLSNGIRHKLRFSTPGVGFVATAIKAGTGPMAAAMIDTLAENVTINQNGYEVYYTPNYEGECRCFQFVGGANKDIIIEASIEHEPISAIQELSRLTKPVRFIFITDMHYRPYEINPNSYNDDGHAPYTSDEDTRWDGVTQNERTQKWINEIKKECKDGNIDFILSAGDTLQADGLGPTNSTGLRLFRERFLSQLSVPFFACVGNHDMQFTDELWMDYYYHHREFSFECGNLYVICPDVCSQKIIRDGSWYPDPIEDHFDWMNAEVAKAKARGMVVAVASHMAQVSAVVDGVTHNYAETLYNWMDVNDVHLYLVGHQHMYQHSKVEGHNIYRLCPGWYANRDPYYYDFTDGWAYDIVELRNGVFSHTHVVPEWNYADTQAKLIEKGSTKVIGDNGYVAGSRTKISSGNVPCKNKDGAMYSTEYMNNMAVYDDPLVTVPPMIPVE